MRLALRLSRSPIIILRKYEAINCKNYNKKRYCIWRLVIMCTKYMFDPPYFIGIKKSRNVCLLRLSKKKKVILKP